MSLLFEPYQLGDLTLPNRIVMAPMTRSRAKTHAADASTARYYAQRASAGLIISEGTQVSRQGQGYLWTPGIYSPEQVAGWRKVTDAVHVNGGRIFAQLWHVGRMSHVSLQTDGAAPVSSTAAQVSTKWPVFAYDEDGNPGQIQASPARALTTDEVRGVVQDFAQGARNAMEAGFNGVELHGAGTYLIDQFINGAINTRDDEYGGASIANRLRFVLEIVDAVSAAIGSRGVGIRISPEGRLHDGTGYPSERETFLTLARELSSRDLAYLHINDLGISEDMVQALRAHYTGTLLITGELNKAKGEARLESGVVDLVGYGRPFIGNPDLVERYQNDWPVTEADHDVFYGGDDHGYTDFPTYQEQEAA